MAFDLATKREYMRRKRAENRKPDFEKLFKALAVMNHLGYSVYAADGHTWIQWDENRKNIFVDVCLNNKIYGGIAEAVETFDAAYQMDGNPPLVDEFDAFGLLVGKGGVDHSRIDKCEGKGGVY